MLLKIIWESQLRRKVAQKKKQICIFICMYVVEQFGNTKGVENSLSFYPRFKKQTKRFNILQLLDLI